ncbi:TRAP transporter small permease [Rubrivivax sp. RP6-9]|uniref:TRAP transporter small permease n=1 Tax=Rubrivivax sp. RP6-9 TaxID=3415750 RepID=UPI003CC599B6
MTGTKPALRAAFDHLARAVRAAILLLVTAMLVTLALQVLMRYGAGQALSWSEELALLCFSWSMLLAIALGVRDAIHVRLDLLVGLLPMPLAQAADRLVALVIAAIGVFLAWSGQSYVVDSLGATSAAIGYPTAWLYACAPVCGGLIALFAFEHLLLGAPPAAAAAPASPD